MHGRRVVVGQGRQSSKERNAGQPELSDLSWMHALSPKEILKALPAISAALDRELALKKLWRKDFDPKCTPLENGIPSLLKRTAFQDENQDSEEAAQEADAVDFLSEEILPTDEVEPDDVEGVSIHPHLPLRAVSPLHRLMRSPPGDLKESIARDLFDAFYFLDHPPKDLLPALCFFEVGIESRALFDFVRREAYEGGRFHLAGKEFTFQEFQKDKLRLFHLIKRKRKSYFSLNRPLLHATKAERAKLATLWDRFDAALKKLTQKQRNAVVEVLIKKRPQTMVAHRLRISLDSLRDRLEGAEVKIRTALPELALLAPSKSHAKNRKRKYLHSGLFEKQAAEMIAPLFRIDPGTGKRTEIPFPKRKKRQNVDQAKIRAWAYETTPVPDFSFTDYFTGLISRGALDRMSTLDTVHDKSASRSNFASKLRAHARAQSHKQASET